MLISPICSYSKNIAKIYLLPEQVKKYYNLKKDDHLQEVKPLNFNTFEVKITMASKKCFKKRLRVYGNQPDIRILELHREMDCNE